MRDPAIPGAPAGASDPSTRRGAATPGDPIVVDPTRGLVPWEPWPIPTPNVPSAGATAQPSSESRTEACLANGGFVPIVYGRNYVAPDVFYAWCYDWNGNDKQLRLGLAFSEGEIDAIESWCIDQTRVIAAGDESKYIEAQDKKLGTLTQTQASAGYYGAAFGSAHGKLPGLAYAYVELVNNVAFVPRAIVRGRKLYDPRLGSWPSGLEPPGAYCAYSANPALIMADLLTSVRYGAAVPTAFVDWTSVSAAAAYCDTVMPTGEKRAECHLVVRDRSSLASWFELVGLHFGGAWRQRDGLFYLDVHKDMTGTSPIAIGEADLVSSPKLSRQGGAGAADQPNRVTVKWIDPSSNWTERTLPVGGSDVEAGASVREGSSYKLHGCQTERQAARTAWYLLNAMAATLTLEADLLPAFLHLRVGDLISVTDSSTGLSATEFTVTDVAPFEGAVRIKATEYNAAIWTMAAYNSGALPGGPGQDIRTAYDPVGVGLVAMSNGGFGLYFDPPVVKNAPLQGASKWSAVGYKTATVPDYAAINNGSASAVAIIFETGAYPTRYVQLDLGAGAASAFRGVWRTCSAKENVFAWVAKYSDNGSSWTTVTPLASASRIQLGSSYWLEEIAWADVGSHRYWRLEITGTTGSGQTDIREIQWWSSDGVYQFVHSYEVHLGPTATGQVVAIIPARGVPSSTAPLDVESQWTLRDTLYTEGGIASPFYGYAVEDLQIVVVTVSTLNQKSAGMGVTTIRRPQETAGIASGAKLAGSFYGQHRAVTVLPALSAAGEGRMSFYGGRYRISEAGGAFRPIPYDVPPGVIVPYGGAAAPTEWLLCNGAAVSRTTYAALFTAIGTTFGAGDGSTTFNLPDLRQRFPLGKAVSGTGSTLGGTGGAIDHTHSVNIPAFTSADRADTAGPQAAAGYGVWQTHTHQIDPPATNSDANNPPFLALNFIVKT